MATFKRNHDKHTTAAEAESNILSALTRAGADKPHRCFSLSQLGYNAFPGYDFRAPQGAAFSVARIVRGMEERGLLGYHCDDFRRGYYLRTHSVVAAGK
jgi:hypothetical protein